MGDEREEKGGGGGGGGLSIWKGGWEEWEGRLWRWGVGVE